MTKYYSFVPNEVIFQLNHDSGLNDGEIIGLLSDQLKQLFTPGEDLNEALIGEINEFENRYGNSKGEDLINVHVLHRIRDTIQSRYKEAREREEEARESEEEAREPIVFLEGNTVTFRRDQRVITCNKRRSRGLDDSTQSAHFSLACGKFTFDLGVSDISYLAFILAIGRALRSNTPLSNTTVNWIMPGADDSAPDQGAGGGPGTRPVPVNEVPDNFGKFSKEVGERVDIFLPEHTAGILSNFEKQESRKAREEVGDTIGNDGIKDDNVHIIVLDSAPPYTIKNKKKYEEYGLRSISDARQNWPDHRILNELFGASVNVPVFEREEFTDRYRFEDTKFSIWYSRFLTYHEEDGWILDELNDDEFDPRRICRAFPDQDGYEYRHIAADHGLFIAGIIRTIAPKINLHLVQVLNNYAYGTMFLIIQQLKYVVEKIRKENGDEVRFVVNMSFMFDIPLDQAHTLESKSQHNGSDPPEERLELEAFLMQLRSAPNWKELFRSFQEVTDSIVTAELISDDDPPYLNGNGIIVAAAGNDRVTGQNMPAARYPAAFDNVVGIGSLRADGDTAKYSNQADELPRWGFATFGGNQDASCPGWSDKGDGVKGVYICQFPRRSNDEECTPEAIAADSHVSTKPGDDKNIDDNSTGWAYWSGTSFAAPVVAALLAQQSAKGANADQAAIKIRKAGLEHHDLPDNVRLTQK